MISRPVHRLTKTEPGRIEAALEGQRRRPGHDDVTGLAIGILAPEDIEFAAVQHDGRPPSGQPRRCAATSAAQAPLPQARVMPAPRSQTRSRIL